MFGAVADTHAALWYLFGDSRLSPAARNFIDQAAQHSRKIALSAISLALANPNQVFEEAPLNGSIVEVMQHVSRTDIPDMPDRIVAATAVYLGVPVISRDGRIRSANLQTVW